MDIRLWIVAVLLALALPAQAHECDPLAVAGGVQIGSASRTVTTSAGSVEVWWCQYVAADNTYHWRMQRPVDLKDCHDLSLLAGALGRIALAPTYATVEAELRAGAKGCIVPPGTQRHYEVRTLQWLGCKALQDPASWPAGVTFTRPTAEDPASPSVYSPDYCGPAPKPPPPPPPPPVTAQYVVTVTQAFPLRADGTRAIALWPQPAIVGEPADGSVTVLQFGATFCKVPRLSTATTTVVAGCRVKP